MALGLSPPNIMYHYHMVEASKCITMVCSVGFRLTISLGYMHLKYICFMHMKTIKVYTHARTKI